MQSYLSSKDAISEESQLSQILLEQNDNYNGLPCSLKNSRFSGLSLDPLLKFPTITPTSFPCYVKKSEAFKADEVKPSKFYEFLHENSPFSNGKPLDLNDSMLLSNEMAPKNSVHGLSSSNVSYEKPFNLADAFGNDHISVNTSNLSSALSLSLSPEKIDHTKNSNQIKCNLSIRPESMRFNSVSSINMSQVRDSVISGAEQILNFSNLEASLLENESKRLYQKIEECPEVPSNDEAIFTGIRTDESLKKKDCFAELVPETEEENSFFMYRSSEALKKAKILPMPTEEDNFSSFDDEGPLMVNTGRLFLNGETASKAKLSGNVPVCRVIQKITPKMLTESSEFVLSTVPETQPSIDSPDMLSPLLKKLVIVECLGNHCKITSAVATSGFNSALTAEFSCEESQCQIYPVQKEGDLFQGLLGTKALKVLLRTKIQWISCGFEHMAAVTTDGKVLTWGYGGSGCLGHGSTLSLFYPTHINSLLSERILYLECGGYHTVAVNEEGEVWVWGRGDVNQLGVDFFLLTKDDVGFVALNPLKIEELVEHEIVVKAVACGEAHTLLLDSEGKVYSFGWADDGQLGNSGSSFFNKTVNLVSNLPSKIVKISAGATFSVGLNDLGHVFVWGNGEQGQLGQGNYVKSAKSPIQVLSLSTEFVVDVVCGESHVMCIAQNGKIFAWGQGLAGYFYDQSVYPLRSDIICFASRNITKVKNYQEIIVNAKNAHNDFLMAVAAKLKDIYIEESLSN